MYEYSKIYVFHRLSLLVLQYKLYNNMHLNLCRLSIVSFSVGVCGSVSECLLFRVLVSC